MGHIIAIATNNSNLLYQFLPINCQYIFTNHSNGNFLPIGSKRFTNHQFTNGIGKFTNSCQWFTIGSYWQWYKGNGKPLGAIGKFLSAIEKLVIDKHWLTMGRKLPMSWLVMIYLLVNWLCKALDQIGNDWQNIGTTNYNN